MSDGVLDRLDFVVCPSYHGATLLALLINNHSMLSSLGDTYPTRRFDQKCGCGEMVSACAFWRDVAEQSGAARFADGDDLLPSTPRITGRRGVDRAFNISAGIAGTVLGRAAWMPFSSSARVWLESYESFRRAVLRHHGTARLVDGQKDRLKILVLRSLLGRKTSIRVVHLLRDPRGFLNSCRKYGDLPLERVAWIWKQSHERIEKFRHWPFRCDYLAVRYEDLCADPPGTMARVFGFLGVPYEDVCRAPDVPEKRHMIGNKMLYGFDGTIRLDQSWRERIPAPDQERVLGLTDPVAARYLYRQD